MARTNGAASSRRHGWMALAALCVVSLCTSGIAWNTLSLFVDPVVTDLGILRTQYMFAPTLIAGLNMLMSLFAFGFLEARFGVRRLMCTGLVLMGIALGVFASAQNLPMLYLAATLWGIGLSWEANSMRNTAVMQWFAKRQSTMISLVAMIGQGAGIVFVALFGALMASTGWCPLLWVACAAHLVAAIVCFFLYKGNPIDLGETLMYSEVAATETFESVEEVEEDGPSFGEMLKTRQFWILCVGWVVLGIGADGIMANLVPIASDMGYETIASLMLSTCLLSSTVTSPVTGWLCDRFGSKVCVASGIGCLIVSCLILCMGIVPVPLMFVVAALLGFVWNTSVVPQASSTVEVFGHRDFAKKNTVFVAMQCLGVAIAPPFLSAFYDFGGGTYSLGFVVTAILAAATMVLFVVGARPAGRNVSSASSSE